jgi:predicted O-methyltransferase YrrM
MRLAAAFARACGARRVLDLGTGFGYTALWLADAVGPTGHVIAVDRHEEHIDEARRFAARFGLDDRTTFIVSDVDDALRDLNQPFDLVHDDAWFAQEQSYLEAMLGALRPGGMVTMPNWFLLEDAITGRPRNDWAAFAGPDWAGATRRYADRLLADAALHVTFVVSPPLGVW